MATAAEIQALYIAYFGRPADPAGLASWLLFQGSLSQIAQSFGTTKEFTSANSGLTTAQSVNQIYRNLFGRDAEPAGLNSWTTLIDSGKLSLAQAGLIISQGAQGADQTALDSKKTAAATYTTTVNSSTAGILAYSGQPGVDAGRAYLQPVTSTATIPSQTATTASVNNLINNQGGGSGGGLHFNQISNDAVLTSTSNLNANGSGAGFTPSASFLSNANDNVVLSVFQSATIIDNSTNDNDVLTLSLAGVALGAANVIGIENINFNGAASFSAANITGAKNINFFQGGRFLAGLSGASTAAVFVGTTGTVGLIGGGSQASLNVTLSAANAGTLSLNSTTALTITNTNTANASYNIRYTAAAAGAGSLTFNGGSIASLSITNTAGGAIAFTGASFSAAGDFTLSLGGPGGSISAGEGFANLNSAAVAFGSTGQVRVIERASIYSANSLNHLGWTNVSAWQFGGSTAALNVTAQQFSAGFSLKNGSVDLSFGTAQSTAAFIYFSDSTAGTINTYIAGGTTGNTLSFGGTAQTAFAATGATDTVNLTFNTLSGVFLMSGAGIGLNSMDNTLSGFTAFTANLGVEILSLNIFGGTSTANHVIQAVTTSTATTTFNLNAAQGVTFSIDSFTRAGSALTTFGFSAADGNNTVNVTTGWTQGVITFFDGSGNSFISLNNLANAQNVSAGVAFGAAYSAYATQLDTVNLSDGGNDTISVGAITIPGSTNYSAFARAQIIGFNAGDVLSFTNYSGTIASFVVATGFTAVTAGGNSAITLVFDGTDTFVFQGLSAIAGWASASDAGNNNLAAVLKGGNYASLSRWSLNANNLVLLS